MMDRNREARRAAAMTNGLPRRRHRTTTTTSGSLRDSPEDDGPVELQEAAQLRDRTTRKDRDREMRERDRDKDRERDRDRDRLSRSKRRRGDKYMHGSNREDAGGDDSSEESVNDEDEDDDDGPVRYVRPSNPVLMSSSPAASALTSHRKSYPPPSKVFKAAPTWKAPDEMIGVSVPRKARTASTKRSHDFWTSGVGGGGVTGEQILRQASSSPVRSSMTASATVSQASPAPLSPSPSNVSVKKKIKPNGPKQRPPKSSSKSSPSIQDEIEIEVAEVLYGLMRQSQGPCKQEAVVSNDSGKIDTREMNRSTGDSKSRVSSPISNPSQAQLLNSNSSAPPLTTVAPKRKRPRPYTDENPAAHGGPRSIPISSTPKVEAADQPLKIEAAPPPTTGKKTESTAENGDSGNSHELPAPVSDAKPLMEESSGGRDGTVRGEVEEASSSQKMESMEQDRVESTISTKTNPVLAEKENHREDKFEIDLMAPPPQSRSSPERERGGGGAGMDDEKPMVPDREAEVVVKAKPNEEEDEKGVKLNAEAKLSLPLDPGPHHKQQQQQKERNNIDLLQLDCSSSGGGGVNDDKLNLQLQKPPQPPPKTTATTTAIDDATTTDKTAAQPSSVPLPMSVPAGWHGGLPPMGYVGPLQGVVSMDGTSMASTPIQAPHFIFSQPRPKRCASHCYIARSISVHQQLMKMNPFWPTAAAATGGSGPLFGGKPYNLNMVPEGAHAHAHAHVHAQEKGGQAFAFFPGQPTSAASKDNKSAQTPPILPDPAQKKPFMLQPTLPPGAPANILHAPTFIFPLGQQQASASVRPSSSKSPTPGTSPSTTTSNSGPMAATPGPAMSFSYPNMTGNDAQFMAILGNGPYPFPIPAHVGATPTYRGSSPHPQAVSFFNGSFYSSQMLHPSQLQQQQPTPQPQPTPSQNHQNVTISNTSSSSQKHRPAQQGNGPNTASGPANPSLQNFQATKGRPNQPQHDLGGGGGEDSPSTADSRTRPNLGVYGHGQNFAMPFHSHNFALTTPPPTSTGVSNGGDRRQQQQQQQPPPQQLAFPMSFTSINGATTPGFDISSMAHNHAILQSLPEAARHNYQIMAAAAAAQAGQQKKNNVDEERKAAMASRTSATSGGQSIAFSRDLPESTNNVVDSSARGLNLVHGSARPTRSSGPNTVTNSNASSDSPQQQQQQQMLFSKQHQLVGSAGRSKTPTTSNGSSVYPDHLTSSVMAARFPTALSGFPPLVQSSGNPNQSPQWKNSVRPNTSQVSSPSIVASSTPSSTKNIPQQQGRPQQNHTQISFGGATNPNPNPNKPSTTPSSQGGQLAHNNNQVQSPSPPMMVGSPSNSSISKGGAGGGSPRTTASGSTGNKPGVQSTTLSSSQQGKNSPSPSLPNQKLSMLGSPHIMSTSSSSASKSPQLQQLSQQQQSQLLKQNIQQAQMFFTNAYMQASASSAGASTGSGSGNGSGSGYYLQRHRPENHQQGSKSQVSGPTTTSSSGMLSMCTPVALPNASSSDPTKAVGPNGMKGGGGMPSSHGIFQAAQFTSQSMGSATHQLVPAGFPYVHAVPTPVQVKPAEKQPAGE